SEFVVTPAGRDRFLQCFSILNDDHFLDARKSDDAVVRNGDSHLRVVRHDLGAHKRSWSQGSSISYVRFNHEHTVLLGDHRTESHDLSDVDILIALDGYANILTRANSARLTLRDLSAQTQRIHSHDVHYRRTRRKIFTNTRPLFLHDTVERSNHPSVF